MKSTIMSLLAALAAGCHKADGPKDPDISDPFRPPVQHGSPYRLRGAEILDNGDILLLVEVQS